MAKLPPIRIELNFDAERKEAAHRSEALDSRLIRVEITNRNIKRDTLKLDVSAPEDESGKLLAGHAPSTLSTLWASDPAKAAGMEPCVVHIRPGTEAYRDGKIEFRMELDIERILAFWGSVEFAAKQEHPILLTAEAEQEHPILLTAKAEPHPKQLFKRRGIVTINLNSIRWKWTPLVRDKHGNIEKGAAEENTPIEVPVDGTNSQGFELELWLEKRQESGYLRAESDFTHYLAPEEPRVTFAVLAPEKIPWKDLAPAENQQVTTTWWTQNLEEDANLLKELPIETTIRVLAWPEHSIVRHRRDEKPLTNPADAAQLATREIPLMLGVRKWKARVLRPDPKELPVLLECQRPWEEGFEVEVEIFDDSSPGQVRVMRNQEVEWRLRPAGETISDTGEPKFSGDVRSGDNKDQPHGTWQTDDRGRITFLFCPKQENSLFLAAKNDQYYYGEFDLIEARPGAPRTVPGAAPDDQGKIPSADTPKDKQAPSFVLEWAPKFDLQVFKLPYFTAETSLNPEAVPDAEHVKAIPLVLNETQKTSYQQLFQTGGTVTIAPVVPIGENQADSEEKELKDFRLIVGSESSDGSQQSPEIVRMEPVSPDSGATDTSEPIRPRKIEVPVSPRAMKLNAKPVELTLKLRTPLHRDVAKLLNDITTITGTMDDKFLNSTAFPVDTCIPGPPTEFTKLGTEFRLRAVELFASRAQADLVAQCRPTFLTLMAAAGYLPTMRRSWKILGDAVQLHRLAYKRTIDNSINFLYDFVYCDEVAEGINHRFGGVLTKIKDKTGIDLSQVRKIKLLHESIQTTVLRSMLGVFMRILNDYLSVFETKWKDLTSALDKHKRDLASLESKIVSAETEFSQAVSDFQQHSNNLVALSNQGRDLLDEFRALAPEQQRAVSESFKERAHQLMRQAADTKQEWSRAGLLVDKHLSSEASSPESLQTLLRQKMLLQARKTTAELEVSAIKAQYQHVKKAAASMKQAENLTLRPEASTTSEVGEVIKGAKLEKVKGEMESAFTALKAPQPEAMTSEAATKLQALHSEAGALVTDYTTDCQRASQGLQTVAAEADGLRQLGALGDSDTWVSRTPPATRLPTGPAVDFSRELQKVSHLQQKSTQAMKNFHDAANFVRLDSQRRVEGLTTVWKAQQDLMAENLSDGVKSGQEHFFQFLDETQASSGEDGAPAQKPEGVDAGWLDWAINRCLDVVDWFASMFKGAWAWACRQLSRLPDLIRFVFWLLMYAVNLVLRLVALLGAKMFEAILAMVDFARSNYSTITYLRPEAYVAGSTCLSKTGSANPDAASGSQLFTFPYLEFQLFDRWKACGKGDVDQLRWEEQYMDQTLRAGYEDYYPRALGEARDCYHRLCKALLSIETLKAPPVDLMPNNSLKIAGESVDRLENHIAQFLKSFEDASPKEKDARFTESFRRLRQKPKWTSVDWDTLADWIGFGFSWVFRFVALLVAVFTWWTGMGLWIAAGAWLTAASLGSAVAAVGRLIPSLFGYYCYTTAYPRDVVMLQAAIHASLFLPATEESFKLSSSDDFLQ
ncbi:hypothetical protein [Methylobacter sp. BlB1]|uniref:hypothetical protein n=1 Tax=Methylobacter sp. BlB1 TaxID=2785914 RepID=UPI0018958BED|nr:hypothetical protein [Methylobacter sp. BlB1]MBF6650994.1 hypothetical protein [Methylobacter sp. BlB1]